MFLRALILITMVIVAKVAENITKIYIFFHSPKKGQISHDELVNYLKKLNIDVTSNEAKKLVKK